jgi:hypothetical protein
VRAPLALIDTHEFRNREKTAARFCPENLPAVGGPAAGKVKRDAGQNVARAPIQRRRNWQEERTKAKMERTIPIFLALTHCDSDSEYHRNYGQLGYALKDSRDPNWEGAEAALSKAIKIRGPWQENGWIYYELNRAICRIVRDDPEQTKPSTQDVRERILQDLRAVFSEEQTRKIANRTAAVDKWIQVNNVSKDELLTSSKRISTPNASGDGPAGGQPLHTTQANA